MINKHLIASFILTLAIGSVSIYGQNNTNAATPKTLKEAYAGKFLIGTSTDLRGLSEAELANVKMHYDINTPENSMKPQPLHPFEGKYNFETPDAMVEWCKQNGIQVWGHTLLWHSQTAPWFFQAVNPRVDETAAPVRGPRAPRDPNAPRLSQSEMWHNSIQGDLATREV